MVLIHDRIIKIDIYNFEMSYKTPEKSLKSNQIYSAENAPTLSIMAFSGLACTMKLGHLSAKIIINSLVSKDPCRK